MRARFLIGSALIVAALAGPLAASRAHAQDGARGSETPGADAMAARLAQIQKAIADAGMAGDVDKLFQAWATLNDLASRSPDAATARDGARSDVTATIAQGLRDRASKKITSLRAAGDHNDANAVRNTFEKLQDTCDQMLALDPSFADETMSLRANGASIATRFGIEARPPQPRLPELLPGPAPGSPEAPPMNPPVVPAPDGSEPADKPPPPITDADLAAMWQEAQDSASNFSLLASKSLATPKLTALAAEAAKQARAVMEKTPTIEAIRSEYVLSQASCVDNLVEAMGAALDEGDSIPHDEAGMSALGDAFLRMRAVTIQIMTAAGRVAGDMPAALYAERTAIESLVHVFEAQWVYKLVGAPGPGGRGFSRSLGALARAEVLDRGDVGSTDYFVEIIGISDAGFQLLATPSGFSTTGGSRSFYLDQSGIVRYALAGAEAGPTTTPTAWALKKPDPAAFLEARALGNVRTLITMQSLFKEAEKSGGKFAADFDSLLAIEDFDPRFARGAVGGYQFTLAGNGETFRIVARPLRPGKPCVKAFFVDESGTVRFTTDGSEPTVESPEVQ